MDEVEKIKNTLDGVRVMLLGAQDALPVVDGYIKVPEKAWHSLFTGMQWALDSITTLLDSIDDVRMED